MGNAAPPSRRPVIGAVAFVGALAVAAAVASPFTSRDARSRVPAPSESVRSGEAAELLNLPAPVRPAFVPGKPVLLRQSAHVSRWAVVRAAVRPRIRPSPRAAMLERLSTRTPEGTSNIVPVLDHRVDEAGAVWIRVRLAALGTPQTGWVPRQALGGYGAVRTRLLVDLDSLEAVLLREGREILRVAIGVGKAASPTPTGEFYIRNRLTGYASPTYGPIAFGTSARSPTLTDWPAGGFVGIHGTDRPDLLPGRVSHGCIRMRNDDILRLARLMPVGTPMTIR